MSEIQEELLQLPLDEMLLCVSPEEEEEEEDVPDKSGSSSVITFTLGELKMYTQNFSERNMVGSGGFSQVYKGLITGRAEGDLNGKEVAIKISFSIRTQEKGLRATHQDMWEAEVTHLPKFSHPNIIQLIGKCETTKRFILVYPLMRRGNVQENLAALDWNKSLRIMRGSASALRELHSQSPSLIFRDFKPDNIMLTADFTPVLCDFGTVMPEGVRCDAGTLGYTDPLTIQFGSGYKANDIYSMGVLILQLIMKKEKVRNEKSNERIKDWATEEYQKEANAVHMSLRGSVCERAITELGLNCVQDNTDARPSIEEVIEVLAGLNDTVERRLIQKLCLPCTTVPMTDE